MTADLQPLIVKAVRRIEAQKVACPSTSHKLVADVQPLPVGKVLHGPFEADCALCRGTGWKVGPAFTPLLEALTVTLPRRHAQSVRVVRDVEALDTGKLLEAMAVIGTPVSARINRGQATVWFGDEDDPLFQWEASTLKEAALTVLCLALPEVKADA